MQQQRSTAPTSLPAQFSALSATPASHQSPSAGPPFGALLRSFRERADISQSALGRRSDVHPSIVNRLESGERSPSGPDLVEALAQGIGLSPDDTDRLFAAGGFAPGVINQLGPGDPTLLLVAQALTDSRVPSDERQRLRDVIAAAARWCRAASR